MRNIRSMCRDIEWWEVNEVQIPGNKIEPQWPLLDTLGACPRINAYRPLIPGQSYGLGV